MSNNENKVIISGNPEDFDLFATPADTHLAEELQKGTFEWTNKYTKALGVLTLVVGLLAVGAWYGHHSATSNTTASASSIRSAFARFAGASAGGSGSGASGGGFGTRITGSIASVSGSTVTITLADPTQASSLKAGDNARITDTGAAGASGGFAGAAGAGAAGSTPSAGGASASPRTSKTRTGTGSSSAGASGSGKAAAGGAGAAGAPGTAGAPGAGAGRAGGLFNNPDLTACLTKAGITMTPGSRPNFQDPATATAIQSCMKSLGITFGGGAGGGGGFGGRGVGGAGTGAGSGATGGTTTP